MAISSAKGILALLRETDTAIIQFALRRLDQVVDALWYEASSDLALLEELYESVNLPEETRQLAALIAAKVYFHLGEYTESVNFALSAGPLFDVSKRSVFTDTILCRCIDLYIEHRNTPAPAVTGADGDGAANNGGNAASGMPSALRYPLTVVSGGAGDGYGSGPTTTAANSIDPARLDALFSHLAEQWTADDDRFLNVKELIGFVLKAKRLDLLVGILKKHIAATNSAEMLTFTFHTANTLVGNYQFRHEILHALSTMYSDSLQTVDYFALAQCLTFLGDAPRMAKVIHTLLTAAAASASPSTSSSPPAVANSPSVSKGDEKILAFQLAFDLFDTGSQDFLLAVTSELQKLDAASAGAGGTEVGRVVTPRYLAALQGEVSTDLYVKFLYARCNTDVHILNQTKKSIDPRNSVTHNATVLANAFMNCGTTIDGFLRDNMEWLSRASQWAKFTATASVGVLHKGHIREAMNILKPFLPDGSVGALPFQEAGSLYALGLIHAPVGATSTEGTTAIEYLRGALRTYSASEQMVHGAALGIGLAAMGLRDEELFDALFTCVSGCDAVAGEGAALAIGMVMLGSGNARVLETLKRHAMEFDQKEKTIRGLSMAMALIVLGREEEGFPLAEELLVHADPWVRLGGVFVIGMAYAGTANPRAVERLLAVAVRDVSDDVRRNAVTMIGFLTFKDPSLCVDMTRVLADSYNPHIRYGVAMALGVAASGTAQKDVVDMLWTLKDDLIDFVRQGAFVALSLVLVQATEKSVPQVKELRQILYRKTGDRKEDTCTKFGCILASGLLEAGGRNCTISLHKQRHTLVKSIVGMFVFSQYWYWFPYTLMLETAIHPTCFIGLNEDLEMPKYTFASNAPASTFAIPMSVLQEKKEAKTSAMAKKVVLSTTKKEEELRERKKRGSMTGADFRPSASLPNASSTTDVAAGGATTAAGKGEDEGHGEASGVTSLPDAGGATAGSDAAAAGSAVELLQNPARVTMQQFAVVSHETDGRYRPLKPKEAFGVCMLRDLDPQSGRNNDDLVAIDPKQKDDTAPVPEPFSWP